MYKERPAAFKILTGSKHGSSGLKKALSFITDLDQHSAGSLVGRFGTDPFLLSDPILDHIRKMMDIDHCLI